MMMRKVFKKMTLGFFGLLALSVVGFGAPVLVSDVAAQGGAANVDQGWSNPTTTYNPDVIGSQNLQEDSLIVTVKRFINWVLGLLALIALGILLWGGFQMVTAAGDENKYKKGFTILKQAGIGLAFIALSWLIVSLIFWVINLTAGGATGGGTA